MRDKSEIGVSSTDSGDNVFKVVTTCKETENYLEGLGPLSLIDLTNKNESRVFPDFIASDMSANCLLPSGMLTAAWVEAEMFTRSMASKGIPLCI